MYSDLISVSLVKLVASAISGSPEWVVMVSCDATFKATSFNYCVFYSIQKQNTPT